MEYRDKTFSDVTEALDGNQYFNCRFENCQIIYRGGQLPGVNGCHFQDCRWQFEDAADRTMMFMRMLYHGLGDSGPKLVEGAFDAVRAPIT